MKLLRTIQDLPDIPGSVIAPGNFDGVHLGHQALLAHLKQKAHALNIPLIVLLFEPQPAEFLMQNQAIARLSSLREKIILLKEQGVDYVFCVKFDQNLAAMQPEAFAEKYLFKACKARYMMVGEDFRFGARRSGDVQLLKELCAKNHSQLEIFSDYIQNSQRISSTRIREILTRGQFAEAEKLAGHPYKIYGRVVSGAGLGRQWNIPTANILLNRKKLPIKGVFCVQVKIDGKVWDAVANAGTRPTVDGTKTILEIHILDFDKSLYGNWLEVTFLHKLREEARFDSVDALIAQIRTDIKMTEHYFNNACRELHHG